MSYRKAFKKFLGEGLKQYAVIGEGQRLRFDCVELRANGHFEMYTTPGNGYQPNGIALKVPAIVVSNPSNRCKVENNPDYIQAKARLESEFEDALGKLYPPLVGEFGSMGVGCTQVKIIASGEIMPKDLKTISLPQVSSKKGVEIIFSFPPPLWLVGYVTTYYAKRNEFVAIADTASSFIVTENGAGDELFG